MRAGGRRQRRRQRNPSGRCHRAAGRGAGGRARGRHEKFGLINLRALPAIKSDRDIDLLFGADGWLSPGGMATAFSFYPLPCAQTSQSPRTHKRTLLSRLYARTLLANCYLDTLWFTYDSRYEKFPRGDDYRIWIFAPSPELINFCANWVSEFEFFNQ